MLAQHHQCIAQLSKLSQGLAWHGKARGQHQAIDQACPGYHGSTAYQAETGQIPPLHACTTDSMHSDECCAGAGPTDQMTGLKHGGPRVHESPLQAVRRWPYGSNRDT